MGSKARVAKDVSAILNSTIQEKKITTYIEPFVGGANLIEHIECENRYGLDVNEYLIAMWKAVQSDWKPPCEISKQEYEEIKNNKENYPKELVAIVGFCATYNAKWFGGYAGIVNTKIGTQRNYYDEAVRNILNQVPKLKNVKFACRSYETIKLDQLENALIYCDPPYEGTTKYKDEFDHEKFWEWVRAASKNNYVYVSEYFECIWSRELKTTLDKNSRKIDTEKLFIYKGIEITSLFADNYNNLFVQNETKLPK
jgi:DNA adenine methylase